MPIHELFNLCPSFVLQFDTKLRCEKAAAIRRIRIDIGNLLIGSFNFLNTIISFGLFELGL